MPPPALMLRKKAPARSEPFDPLPYREDHDDREDTGATRFDEARREPMTPLSNWDDLTAALHAIEVEVKGEKAPPAPLIPPPKLSRPDAGHGDVHVIHVAGRLGDSVSRFLHSATALLADAGVSQTLVLVDDPAPPAWVENASTYLQLIECPGTIGRVRTWLNAMRQVAAIAETWPDACIHLHGLLPSLFGARALRSGDTDAQIVYSLHGAKALAPWPSIAAAPLWMLSRRLKRPQVRMMSSPIMEDHSPRWFSDQSPEYVETPVLPAYFEHEHREANKPLILSGARCGESKGATLFAQLAVLLGGEELRLRFGWLGAATQEDAAHLKAADVGRWQDPSDLEQAANLSSAWIYLSLNDQKTFAHDIAQALAAGVPCVARDTRSNRHLIDHGRTGYLCRNQQDMLHRVAELLDNGKLRRRMSLAARESALRRFTEAGFQSSLLKAYGFEEVMV